jgi:hypothetical protein
MNIMNELRLEAGRGDGVRSPSVLRDPPLRACARARLSRFLPRSLAPSLALCAACVLCGLCFAGFGSAASCEFQ